MSQIEGSWARAPGERCRRDPLVWLAGQFVRHGWKAEVVTPGAEGAELLKVTNPYDGRTGLVASVPVPRGDWTLLWPGGRALASDPRTVQMIIERVGR